MSFKIFRISKNIGKIMKFFFFVMFAKTGFFGAENLEFAIL